MNSRRRNILRGAVLAFVVLEAVIVSFATIQRWRLEHRSVPPPSVRRLQLPFPAGWQGRAIQGPDGWYSHRGVDAWDFGLSDGASVVAAAPGRVIHVVDDRTAEGTDSYRDANRIIIDHGDGVFGSYLHHRARSARVTAGQLVQAGDLLAIQGSTGTREAHVHFDLRGPGWRGRQDAAFLSREWPNGQRVEGRETLTSVNTRATPAEVRDTVLRGSDFSANGITLDEGLGPAYLFTAGQERTFSGRLMLGPGHVAFDLWREETPTEYNVTVPTDAKGFFSLTIRVPASSRGPRWYRIGPTRSGPPPPDEETMPALVR